jgi:hypothetical protein
LRASIHLCMSSGIRGLFFVIVAPDFSDAILASC